MSSSQRSFESTHAWLSRPTHDGGMEPGIDFLHLFTALLRNEDGCVARLRLTELAYNLNDRQRNALGQLAEAAGRLDDAAIAAEITEEQFEAQQTRRFGRKNPEKMDVPFWRFMVRRGWKPWQARNRFHKARGRDKDTHGPPVWCFDRFGMSQTRLPDGRLLFIGGEHEDTGDRDFCIYNDVVVIDRELQVTIYGYPEKDFPPTDSHTATLVGDADVYIIGNLGYRNTRRPGSTPVYWLDTRDMQIMEIDTSGENPGWISSHEARFVAERNSLEVIGGKTLIGGDGGRFEDNGSIFRLDLETMTWARQKPP